MGVVERGAGWRRRIAALMLALALFLLPSAEAFAGRVLPGYEQWDYWGRWPPLPVYVPVWAADQKVCTRILRALNGAGPLPASLYGNSIFLRWQPYTAFPKDDEFDLSFAEWIKVPFFNDGKPVVALRLVSPSSRFIDEYLFVFDDVEYFRAFKPVPLVELLKDPRVLQPYESFMGKRLGSFIEFPSTMKDYEYWKPTWLGDNVEINIAKVGTNFYLVVREPSLETIVVLFFTANQRAQAACLIGPKVLVR